MQSSKPKAEGWCPECGGERKLGKWEDMGIGAYEYWGAKGTHRDWQLVCPDCGEIMEDLEEINEDPVEGFGGQRGSL